MEHGTLWRGKCDNFGGCGDVSRGADGDDAATIHGLTFSFDDKSICHCLHTDLRVIFHGGRRRQQEQHTFIADGLFCQLYQPFADAFFLIFFSYSQVGKVTAVVKICYGAGDAYQQGAVPGGDHEAGMTVHITDPFGVAGWAAEAGAVV